MTLDQALALAQVPARLREQRDQAFRLRPAQALEIDSQQDLGLELVNLYTAISILGHVQTAQSESKAILKERTEAHHQG